MSWTSGGGGERSALGPDDWAWVREAETVCADWRLGPGFGPRGNLTRTKRAQLRSVPVPALPDL
jgi:hypothetical protein